MAILLFGFGPLAFGTGARAQSVALELGINYDETEALEFSGNLKLGLRGVYPLDGPLGLYVAPYWAGGVGVDAGVWYAFRVGADDVAGLRSYAGAGLGVTRGRVGLALSGALGYTLGRDLELVLVYTHRPLLTPRLSQTFDISLGLKYAFDLEPEP